MSDAVVPDYLRRRLREHQEATDCSDDRMVEILCAYIEACDAGDQPLPHEDHVYSVIEFVVEQLEKAPPHAQG